MSDVNTNAAPNEPATPAATARVPTTLSRRQTLHFLGAAGLTLAASPLALAQTAQPAIPHAELAMLAEDFSTTAASHDYQSLLAISSALVGVSRDRVQALLGLR